jgi:hypothetical protein
MCLLKLQRTLQIGVLADALESHPYNGILFSLLKEDNLQLVITWINMEDFMLNEISQSQDG